MDNAMEFVPPSFDEVKQYAIDAGLIDKISVTKFYRYYERADFLYKGLPMDWKSRMKQWAETQRTPVNTMANAGDYHFQHSSKYETREYLDYVKKVADSWGDGKQPEKKAKREEHVWQSPEELGAL